MYVVVVTEWITLQRCLSYIKKLALLEGSKYHGESKCWEMIVNPSYVRASDDSVSQSVSQLLSVIY